MTYSDHSEVKLKFYNKKWKQNNGKILNTFKNI